MVGLVLLDLPYSLVLEWPINFTIWRHGQGNTHIWGQKTSWYLSKGLLWVQTRQIKCCGCGAHCLPNHLCFSLCLLHRENKLPKEIETDITDCFLCIMVATVQFSCIEI